VIKDTPIKGIESILEALPRKEGAALKGKGIE
jgi:hypothetical protein